MLNDDQLIPDSVLTLPRDILQWIYGNRMSLFPGKAGSNLIREKKYPYLFKIASLANRCLIRFLQFPFYINHPCPEIAYPPSKGRLKIKTVIPTARNVPFSFCLLIARTGTTNRT
jgi:hypothetical protein